MYETIYHPKKQKWVSLKSRSGGRVLARYMRQLQWGGAGVPEEDPAYYQVSVPSIIKLLLPENTKIFLTDNKKTGQYVIEIVSVQPSICMVNKKDDWNAGDTVLITNPHPSGEDLYVKVPDIDDTEKFPIEVSQPPTNINVYTVIIIDKSSLTDITSTTHQIKTVYFSLVFLQLALKLL